MTLRDHLLPRQLSGSVAAALPPKAVAALRARRGSSWPLSTARTCSTHAAARDRTFVASYGTDSGSCTFGSPCKIFQFAVNNTAVGGEVTAIDSAGFQPVTISNSISSAPLYGI
jgi:hypothetical protein